MALSSITFPPQQCFIGGVTQRPNRIEFNATSNLFPTNTADTARTILAKGDTDSGFFWIEVDSSHAAQFPQGSFVTILGKQARILSSSTPSNYRMVLNIQDIGVTATSDTVIQFYKDWGLEIRLVVGSVTLDRVFNALPIDLGEMMRVFIQSYFEQVDAELRTADSVDCVLSYREVYLGHSNAFTPYATTLNLNRGRTEAGQTVPSDGFFTARPNITYVVNGQKIPLGFYNQEGAAQIDIDYGQYVKELSVTAQDRQRLLLIDAFAGYGHGSITFEGVTKQLIFVNTTLPWIELHWRDMLGTWQSHYFYVTDKRHEVAKEQPYRKDTIEQATTQGTQITAQGVRLFQTAAQDIWTLQTGKVSDDSAAWLRSLLDADEVFYRDGENFYPVIILAGEVPFYAESQLAEMSFEMISAYGLQLKDPAMPTPIDPIVTEWDAWNALCDADGAVPIENNACAFAEFKAVLLS